MGSWNMLKYCLVVGILSLLIPLTLYFTCFTGSSINDTTETVSSDGVAIAMSIQNVSQDGEAKSKVQIRFNKRKLLNYCDQNMYINKVFKINGFIYVDWQHNLTKLNTDQIKQIFLYNLWNQRRNSCVLNRQVERIITNIDEEERKVSAKEPVTGNRFAEPSATTQGRGDESARYVADDVKSRREKSGEKTPNSTTFVCNILLTALLVVSAGVGLYEVFKDKIKSSDMVEGEFSGDVRNTVQGSRTDSRRCSLVDLTVSRHERRESQLQMYQTEVNATTRHGKLLGARPAPMVRRSSFPVHSCCPPLSKQQSLPCNIRATPKMSRNTSVEGSEGDSSPDTRRRIRFIRRH